MKRNLLLFTPVLSLVLLPGVIVNSLTALGQERSPMPPSKPTEIAVTEKGFEPVTVTVRANALAKIIFVRKTDKTCATEIVIPEYNIKRQLPLNKPVVVEFTPKKAGDIAFACGMGMFSGKIVAQRQ